MTPPPALLLPLPRPVHRPWGGAQAATLFGYAEGASSLAVEPPHGEWWLLSARQDCVSELVDGRPLTSALDDDASDLLGRPLPPAWRCRFPLLVKVLDTARSLSLQVHPDDAAVPGEGKTESWYILRAAPGARLFAGLRNGVAAEELLRRAASREDPAPLLVEFTPEAGDVFHIPAGLVHALGAGIVAIEIQQNSDTTYRIFDWIEKRNLHHQAALSAIDPLLRAGAPRPRRLQDDPFVRELLVQCAHYTIERLRFSAEIELSTDGSRFHLLLPLDGDLEIERDGATARVRAGRAALIPAAAAVSTVRWTEPPTAGAELLRVVPERP